MAPLAPAPSSRSLKGPQDLTKPVRSCVRNSKPSCEGRVGSQLLFAVSEKGFSRSLRLRARAGVASAELMQSGKRYRNIFSQFCLACTDGLNSLPRVPSAIKNRPSAPKRPANLSQVRPTPPKTVENVVTMVVADIICTTGFTGVVQQECTYLDISDVCVTWRIAGCGSKFSNPFSSN